MRNDDPSSGPWNEYLFAMAERLEDATVPFRHLQSELKQLGDEVRKEVKALEGSYLEKATKISGDVKEFLGRVDEVCEACDGPVWNHDLPHQHQSICRACIGEMASDDCVERMGRLRRILKNTRGLGPEDRVKAAIEEVEEFFFQWDAWKDKADQYAAELIEKRILLARKRTTE
jgi:hypothetical protein